MDGTIDADVGNEVRLVGRVSAVLQERVLPSGDVVVPLRVVVPRARDGDARAGPRSRAVVDVIDVACWSAAAREVAAELTAGDTVAVQGPLRRRFFRAGASVQSRYEVEAGLLRRLREAPSPPP